MRNNMYRGKAMSVTHSDSLFVALDIQHAMCMCHSDICGVFGSTVLSHIIS